MNILHITDFHINNFQAGSKELLKRANYKQYLYELMEISKEENVDCLVVTGDLINLSKTENVDFVIEIIDYMIAMIGISKERVFIVNGNHDIPRVDGSTEAIERIQTALSNHGERIVDKSDRYSLINLGDDVAALLLDSIGESYQTGSPTDLSTQDFDHILELIEEHKFKNVIVASHHPPESYRGQNQAMLDEGPSFSKHIWPHGGKLRRDLGHPATSVEKIIWFCGDTHRAEHAIIDSKTAIINTGSFNHVMRESQKDVSKDTLPPQARIISFQDIERSKLIIYVFDGHNKIQGEGEWKAMNSSTTNHDNKSNHSKESKLVEQLVNEITEIERNLNNLDSPKIQNVAVNYAQDNPLNPELNKKIVDFVEKHKLYKQGVYGLNELKSLKWISITPLLSDRAIFREVINTFKNDIDLTLEKLSLAKSDVILVGVDNWGSIIAHRLGGGTNIKCCNIGVGNNEGSYLPEETLNEELKIILEKKKLVMFITDVIASGNTLEMIYKHVNTSNCIFQCMTVIFDKSQNRTSDLSFLSEIKILCNEIRTPLMESKYL